MVSVPAPPSQHREGEWCSLPCTTASPHSKRIIITCVTCILLTCGAHPLPATATPSATVMEGADDNTTSGDEADAGHGSTAADNIAQPPDNSHTYEPQQPANSSPPPHGEPVLTFTSTVEAPKGTVPNSPTGEADTAPTAFTTVLDTAHAPAGARSVGDLLKASPGTKIRSTGSMGLFQQLSIRGSETGQVQFFMDGIPMDRAATSFTDIGRLPLASVDRVEVFRGTVPAHLGGGGIGGAVNVISYRGQETDNESNIQRQTGNMALELGAGSWTTRTITARGALPLADGRAGKLRAAAHYEGSEGDFTFFDNNGTPLNSQDDRHTTRINNHHDTGRAHLSYELPIPHKHGLGGYTWLHSKLSSGLTRAGVPGPGTVQAGRASLSLFDTTGETGFTSRNLLTPGSEFRGSLWASIQNIQFTDPLGEVALGRPNSDDWNKSIGIWTGVRLPLGALNTLSAGISVKHETHTPGGPRPQGSIGDKQRLSAAINLGDDLYLWNHRIVIPLALRLETFHSTGIPADDLPGKSAVSNLGSGNGAGAGAGTVAETRTAAVGNPENSPTTQTLLLFSPRTGLKVTPIPWLTFMANGGLFHRAPTFAELYGESGVIVANSDLKPEKGLNMDAGLGLNLIRASLYLQIALFHNKLEDALVMIHNTRSTRKAENLGEATINGLELNLRGGPWYGLEIQASHSVLDAINNSPILSQNGKSLPGRPEYQFTGSILHRSFGGRIQVRYDLEATGLAYMDPVNFKPIPPRTIHNIGLDYPIPFLKNTTIQLSVKNLTDQRVEQVPLVPRAPADPETVGQALSDFIGYPLPGRSFFALVRWETGANNEVAD